MIKAKYIWLSNLIIGLTLIIISAIFTEEDLVIQLILSTGCILVGCSATIFNFIRGGIIDSNERLNWWKEFKRGK